MSAEQKTIKILSLLFLVIGILRIVLGVVFLFAPEADFTAIGVLPFASSPNAVKMISVAVMVVYGLFTIYFGWKGVKAANRPRTMEGYVKLCYLAILILVLEALIPTSNHVAAIGSLVLSVILVLISLGNARKVVKRADK